MKRQIRQIMPKSLRNAIRNRREVKDLLSIQSLDCPAECLLSAKELALAEIFGSQEIQCEWNAIKTSLDLFEIPNGTGGVNPGDRRAIYYIIRKISPKSVLEIGTHIGASMVHIAAALEKCQVPINKNHSRLVTVDIRDVNDPVSKYWSNSGSKYSPLEMINRMEFGHFVEFKKAASLNYLSECQEKYDFIFLDGDHSAKTVYKEIPAALRLLNRAGSILLHDYFPELKPLWPDSDVIPGPYLAAERLKSEGSKIEVLPLGELPWPTKLQSSVTSLAMLVRRDNTI